MAMKAKMFLWLLLIAGVTEGGTGIVAAQGVGWMQPGVRLWYLGATDGGGVISSNATETYLITTIVGTSAQVIRHSAQTNWTSPYPPDTGTYSQLDQGPCWMHPARLQTIQIGDYWRDRARVTDVKADAHLLDVHEHSPSCQAAPAAH
jgi:hypothetical protein